MAAILARPLEIKISKCKCGGKLKVKISGQRRILVGILGHAHSKQCGDWVWLGKEGALPYAKDALTILIDMYRGVNFQPGNTS